MMEEIIKYNSGHDHPLRGPLIYNYTRKKVPRKVLKCDGCKQGNKYDVTSYYCPEGGCLYKYKLHHLCAKLVGRTQVDHPLHPQHPLTFHSKSFPNDHKTQFVCTFCNKKTKTTSSRGGCCFLLHCALCDFYLDFYCARRFQHKFEQNELLLSQYQFQHFFHPHQNHNLFPYISNFYGVCCEACGFSFEKGEPIFKCSGCEYYLHVLCFRVPKEMKHPLHPQHTLTLLERPPYVDDDDGDDDGVVLRCPACQFKINKNAYVLHCNQCPDFNLDTRCAFVNPTFKYDRHHEHLLVYFDFYDGYELCYVCDDFCYKDLYRCFACNFNIHKACAPLPLVIADYDRQVHPFTLMIYASLTEDKHGKYFCDVCEERRKPNHGVYSCVECPSFVAHFECLLPESYTVGIPPWMSQQFIRDVKNEADKLAWELTSDEKQLVSQLNRKIKKMGEMVRQLRRNGRRENVTETLDELEESNAEAEVILRQLRDQLMNQIVIYVN